MANESSSLWAPGSSSAAPCSPAMRVSSTAAPAPAPVRVANPHVVQDARDSDTLWFERCRMVVMKVDGDAPPETYKSNSPGREMVMSMKQKGPWCASLRKDVPTSLPTPEALSDAVDGFGS